jgi:putative heme-binding domain-containing protein
MVVAIEHADPHVRSCLVRLVADPKEEVKSSLVISYLNSLAKDEADAEVRSQLASSAKRLPGEQGLAVARAMLGHEGDEKDGHIPMLIWWAVESKMATHRDAIVDWFKDVAIWKSAVGRETVAPRVARWLAGRGTAEDQRALLALLRSAPSAVERDLLLAGVNLAFEGRQIPKLEPELAAILAKSGNVEIAARSGDAAALASVIASIADDDAKLKDKQVKAIELLGQVGPAEAGAALLKVAMGSKWHSVRRAALAALVRYSDVEIGRAIVAGYGELPADQGVRPAAISTLLARKSWSLELLRAIEAGRIAKGDVTSDQVDRLRLSEDKAVVAMVQKVFGALARPSSKEKEAEIARVKRVLGAGYGDAKAGRAIFAARCGACHTLFKEGGQVGPDLTGYERRNTDFLLISIVDPSAAIREEYTNFRIDTTDDQTLVGLIKERGPDSVTIVDATQQRTVVAKREIREERALSLSIMPEGLLTGLGEGELRDLFAYLQAAGAPPK